MRSNIEGRRPMSSVRGDEGRLTRVPLIDLSVTGEGPVRANPTAPVDGESLVSDVKRVRSRSRLMKRLARLQPGESIRFR